MLTIQNLKNVDQNVVRTVAEWLFQEWGNTDARYTSVEAVIANLETRDHTVVAFLDGVAIGTISLVDKDDLPTDLVGWIGDFVVAGNKRGQGYGTQLLKHFITYVEETLPGQAIYIYILEPELMDFYQKFGWKVIGRQYHEDAKQEVSIMERK